MQPLNQVSRILFTSVPSVHWVEMNRSKPIDEEKKWPGNDGQSNYGISKYFGEMEVWRGMGEGLSPLIVNPATLLGLWRLESYELRLI